MFSGKEFHNLGAATMEDDRQESLIIGQKGTNLNTQWVNSSHQSGLSVGVRFMEVRGSAKKQYFRQRFQNKAI